MSRGRSKKGKQLKKDIYLFTEGQTEKNYFNILNKKYNSTSNVKVLITPTGRQGQELLNYAEGKLRTLSKLDKSKFEKAYIIFDKDALTDEVISDVLCQVNSNNKIEVGFSNNCFEVWLLCHFETPNSSFCITKNIYEKLEQYLNCDQYAKNHKDDIEVLEGIEDNINVAFRHCERFEFLDQTKIKEKPYTNIGQIIKQVYKRDIY